MSVAKRSLELLLVVVLMASVLAASARAGTKDPSKVKCDDHPLRQPFTPWQDVADYALIGGGDFEKKVDDWVLTGDARPVGGNESFFVGHHNDDKSLALPSGSDATTGKICVGISHPSLRFFLKRVDVDGPADAFINVQATVRDPTDPVRTVTISAHVAGNTAWAPSDPVVVDNTVLEPLGATTLPATFTFTPSPASSWQIDDVHIDPWRSR